MHTLKWYVLKVFYNRFTDLVETFNRDSLQWYIPMTTKVFAMADGREVERRVPLVSMLMFLRCSEEYIVHLNRVLYEKAMVYCHPGTEIPAPIRDKEMYDFQYATTLFDRGLEVVDLDLSNPDKNIRYRVTGGEMEGTEGYIRRVHGTKKLIITIPQVISVATTFVPRNYLQPISKLPTSLETVSA